MAEVWRSVRESHEPHWWPGAVRGVCALRPGIEGLSENIRVRSIVGRFLEHSRIFYFENAGAEDVYLASADWMARNFFRRIELCFPVLDAGLKRRVIREGLLPYLDDNSQAWVMHAEGNYERLRPRKGAKGRSAQEELLAALASGGPGELRAPAPLPAPKPAPTTAS